MSRRILFVVEGSKAEPRFMKKILESYGIAEDVESPIVRIQVRFQEEEKGVIPSLLDRATNH